MILAEERGLTWLLHIDIDELFCTEESDVSAHFAWLDSQGVYAMTYKNHEGTITCSKCGERLVGLAWGLTLIAVRDEQACPRRSML